MKGFWKVRWDLIIKDVKEHLAAVAAITGYIVVGSLLFGTVCPVQLFFGIPCPGCGLTRAAILFLTGHPIRAFFMHPFLYGWIVIAADYFVNRYLLLRKPKEMTVLVVLLCVGMLVLYGYRMLTLYPHTEPMKPLSKGLAWQARQVAMQVLRKLIR